MHVVVASSAKVRKAMVVLRGDGSRPLSWTLAAAMEPTAVHGAHSFCRPSMNTAVHSGVGTVSSSMVSVPESSPGPSLASISKPTMRGNLESDCMFCSSTGSKKLGLCTRKRCRRAEEIRCHGEAAIARLKR